MMIEMKLSFQSCHFIISIMCSVKESFFFMKCHHVKLKFMDDLSRSNGFHLMNIEYAKKNTEWVSPKLPTIFSQFSCVTAVTTQTQQDTSI